MLNQDPRGAIVGYDIGRTFYGKWSMCMSMRGYGFIGYNEAVNETKACALCTAERMQPDNVPATSLYYRSGGAPVPGQQSQTVIELKDKLLRLLK